MAANESTFNIKLSATGDGAASAAFDRVGGSVKKLEASAKSSFESLKANWLGLSVAAAAAAAAIEHAWHMAEAAAEFNETKQNLHNYAAAYNTTADAILAAMNHATEGLVNNKNLANAALRGIGRGLTPEQIVRISEYSVALAKINHEDPSEVINRMTTAIASGKDKAIKAAAGLAGITTEWNALAAASTRSEKIEAALDILKGRAEQFKDLAGSVKDAADEMKRVQIGLENAKLDAGAPLIRGIFFFMAALEGAKSIAYDLIATFVHWKEVGQITILALSAGIEKMLSWIYAGMAAFDRLAAKTMFGKAKQEARAAAAEEKKRSEEYAASAQRDIIAGAKLVGLTKERKVWEDKVLESQKKAKEYRALYFADNVIKDPSGAAVKRSKAQIAADAAADAKRVADAEAEAEMKIQTQNNAKASAKQKAINELNAHILMLTLKDQKDEEAAIKAQAKEWLAKGANAAKVHAWELAEYKKLADAKALLAEAEREKELDAFIRMSEKRAKIALDEIHTAFEARKAADKEYFDQLNSALEIANLRKQYNQSAVGNNTSEISALASGSRGMGMAVEGYAGIANIATGQDAYTQQFEKLNEYNDKRIEAIRDATAKESAIKDEEARNDAARTQLTERLKLSTISSSFGMAAGLAMTYYEQSKGQNRASFEAYKAFAIAQAGINTYLAASNALALPIPPPLPEIAATLAVIAGLANMANIAAQEPPKYHTGGIVGQPGTSSAEVLALLQRGEGVVSRSDMSRSSATPTPPIDYDRLAAAIAAGLPQTIIVNDVDRSYIHGAMTDRTGSKIIRNTVGR